MTMKKTMRRSEIEARRAALEAELLALEQEVKEEEVKVDDEGFFEHFEHEANRAGKGFPRDIYDIANDDIMTVRDNVVRCIYRTIATNNLPETARMRVLMANKYHSNYYVSSKLMTITELKNWIENEMEDKLHKYEEAALPDRIEVGWVATDGNGRGSRSERSTAMNTHAFDTGLCGAISIALGEARNNYAKIIENSQKLYPSMKLADQKKQLNSKDLEAVKKWECMSNDKQSAILNSKSSNMRIEEARMLCTLANITVSTKGLSFIDCHKIIDSISESRKVQWGLQIFNKNGVCLSSSVQCLTEEETQEKASKVKHWIYLLFDDGHYQLIKSLASLCDKSGKVYCPVCKSLKESCHKCVRNCFCCDAKEDHKNDKEVKVLCKSCNLTFFSKRCYEYHLIKKRCEKKYKCTKCDKVFGTKKSPYVNSKEHKCEESVYCKNCKKWVQEWPEHQCYIKRKTPKKPIKKYTREDGTEVDMIMYCDFECTQDTEARRGEKTIYMHGVNFVASYEADGRRLPDFFNISDWFDYISQDRFTGYTVFFHNAGGYDAHFVSKEATLRGVDFVPQFSQGSRMRSCILQRLKKDSVKFSQVKIIDTGSFLAMPLATFTKTFNLKTKKGYYPHELNTHLNANLVCKLSDISENLFGYERMSKEDQKDFSKWYNENKEMVWDNAKELREYCYADVELLRQGFEEFRKIVKDATICDKIWVDPACYTTLPAVAKAVWRFNHVTEQTIACLPTFLTRELTPAMRGGRTELFHMHWKAKEGEKGHYVDYTSLYPYVNRFGLYPKGHPVYKEFPFSITSKSDISEILFGEGEGVVWCDVECPQNIRFPVLPMLRDGKLMFDLMDRKHTKEDPVVYCSLELKAAITRGYKVTAIHKICWWKETVIGIFASYVDTFFKIKSEADGLGEVDSSEEEMNVAITEEIASQYQEHMVKMNLSEKSLNEYISMFWAGFECCQKPPITPQQEGTKTFTTSEISKMVEEDLKKLNIAKLRTRRMTPDEIAKFVQKFADKQQIHLDVSKMMKSNSGMRAVAKLFLNSLWGKMGEKLDYDSHEILYDSIASQKRHVALDNQNKIRDFINISEVCTIVIKKPEDRIESDVINERNMALAIFTTCQARLKLLDLLETCGFRVLYCDTDSCIFYTLKGEDPNTILFGETGKKLGTMLGELTSEIGDKIKFGALFIKEFDASGPKSYMYMLSNGEFVLKCKGLPIKRSDVAAQLTYEKAQAAILNNAQIIVNMPKCIFRPSRFEVATESRTKIFRNSHTKSKLLSVQDPDKWETRPWGNADKEEFLQLIEAVKNGESPVEFYNTAKRKLNEEPLENIYKRQAL